MDLFLASSYKWECLIGQGGRLLDGAHFGVGGLGMCGERASKGREKNNSWPFFFFFKTRSGVIGFCWNSTRARILETGVIHRPQLRRDSAELVAGPAQSRQDSRTSPGSVNASVEASNLQTRVIRIREIREEEVSSRRCTK